MVLKKRKCGEWRTEKEVEDIFANEETNSMESHIKRWFFPFFNTVKNGENVTLKWNLISSVIRPSEGYSILSGFGNDEVLHHLPLEGQCLGKKKEKSKIILKKYLE